MTNKFVFVFFLLSLSWISIVSAIGETSCPFPSHLKSTYDYNWRSNQRDWETTDSEASYFILSLSWSPTHCSSLPDAVRNAEFQCSRSHSFGLIVHGLWPQASEASSVRDHPRNCRNEQQLPLSTIKRYYCIMPDEDLMQGEWEKHGSCYYKTATEYFSTIDKLYHQLNIPDISAIENPTYLSIKNAFVELNSPELFPSAVYVTMDRKQKDQLREIQICYDLQYKFIKCPQQNNRKPHKSKKKKKHRWNKHHL